MNWAEARERLAAPIFTPLRPRIDALPAQRWPTHGELTEVARGAITSRGKPIRFVSPREGSDRDRPYYERHIAETGEVETRPANWHDLFNALVWCAFPRAKAQINAQHAAILAEGGEAEARRRSPGRDALTLFDEGGVAVVSRSPELLRLIVDFEWKELFWHRRAQLERSVRFFAFGHALYEKALEPHIGIVAKTVFVPAGDFFFMSSVESQVALADEMLAAHFSRRARFPSPKAMAPVPVMGIPGWHPRTDDEAFYDDPAHFRGKIAE